MCKLTSQPGEKTIIISIYCNLRRTKVGAKNEVVKNTVASILDGPIESVN